jgi:hypothetical protein
MKVPTARRRVLVAGAIALLAGLLPVASAAAGDGPSPDTVVTPAAVRFSDVAPGVYYEQPVGWLVGKEITGGFGGPGKYSPDAPVTRRQMALFMYRLQGRPESRTECGFTDLGVATEEFRLASCWLKDESITTGYNNDPTTFAPEVAVTRGQMAAFLWRLTGKVESPDLCGYRDPSSNEDFRRGSCWLKANRITTGYGGDAGRYAPEITVTRGQMAAFLFRMTAAPQAWNIKRFTSASYDCEILSQRHCLLPFPSDTFTVESDTTDSGRQLALQPTATPVNKNGRRIDPAEQNRNDGFSPGQIISTFVPQLDLDETGAAPITDIGASVDAGSPTLILRARTGERHPHWAEQDSQATSDDDRLTMLVPARNYEEGERYIVVLRDLLDTSGDPIIADAPMRAYLSGEVTAVPVIEDRRERMDALLDELDQLGVSRAGIHSVWDFTVASERNLAERMLHIRDDAFGRLGTAAPTFTAAAATGNPFEINGTYQVPNYGIDRPGKPGGAPFNWGANGLPKRNTTTPNLTVPFRCILPSNGSATPGNQARMSLYGHGLLGNYTEVSAGNVRNFANEHNVMFCATFWAGFSSADLFNALDALNDLSTFNAIGDGAQQGFLNQLFLGRLMRHANGFASHPAFQSAGQPVIDRTKLSYDGNSQGGIMGGALTAVSNEFDRAVLGVPGMNYSILLYRSSDWPSYAQIFNPAYPDELERPLALNLTQILWDRIEANGYAHHLTDDPLSVAGYEPTQAHQVLLHVAYADHQVAIVTADNMARTAGIRLYEPALTSDRASFWNQAAPFDNPDAAPFWGITRLTENEITDGFAGSVYVMWDSGNTPPPVVNRAPGSAGYPDVKRDPHSEPRAQVSARSQKSAFFNGTFLDVCQGACLAPF